MIPVFLLINSYEQAALTLYEQIVNHAINEVKFLSSSPELESNQTPTFSSSLTELRQNTRQVGVIHELPLQNNKGLSPILHKLYTSQNYINNLTNKISQSPDSSNKKSEEKSPQFVVLPVGINIGKRNILESAFVRGYEDGAKAVNFSDWLVTFKDVTTALNLTVTNLPDGQIEITGVGLIKRINPNELTTDPELGTVISIAKIEELLGVKSQFDIVDYSIIFEPPWLNSQGKKNRILEPPVILEGLPVVKSSDLTFSNFAQQVNINGSDNSNQLTTQGNLTTIGTILGGSWLLKINQPDLLDNTTWKIQEAQYFKPGEFNDYIIGSQPTFWQSQGRGDYWGFTTIKRFGFKPDNLNGNTYFPAQRLQSNTINRIIEGAAKPGTLVQLVSGGNNTIWGQVLVDSTGVYRFDNIPVGSNGGNYRVLLYANGQLASTPIEQQPIFLNLPGQLTKGTSSLIVSGGLSRQTTSNELFGDLTDIRGGVGYRYGVSDALTLGAGIVYDRSLLGLFDIFYQPNNFPLKLAVSALQTPDKFKYNANIEFRPSPKLSLNLSSNELFESFNFNWNVAKGLNISSSGNNNNDIINVGFNLNQNFGNIFTYSTLKIDNKGQLDLLSNARWWKFNVSTRSNSTGLGLQLNYDGDIFNSPGNESLTLGYETNNFKNLNNDLLTLKWKYQSPYSQTKQRSIWDFDLGYGMGSQGNGFLASVSTVVIPGLSLRLRYDGVSLTSDSASYRIEIGSAVNFSPIFSPGDTRFERLRTEGGIFIQSFLDKNNNGIRDNNEEIYTEDTELLLMLNNKKLNFNNSNITKQGVFIRLEPGIYRLDLDPAGYPLDYKPTQVSSAIEVVAGSYTNVSIPFIASYTLAGTVTDSQGKPIAGARVEAINSNNKSSVYSITNSAGVFYLEQLPLGTYQLIINGKPAEPNTVTINADDSRLKELNLKLP
ncbi:carboxypeptidase-like regulatory domain-containing protein [Sphaerospermopsis sp. LEGE 08334]|uniref:carboxypeptidase-like regulatory domain-containing protein n=1 Tax=Sphaerospermopsis sp. LEGE 08334 TaxID=1828651 RepID=UPI0018826C7A|nr:carboxypeptidase-like regulatory domain-containing protein [Sphaerospermopsis sp. LEGE 08334]MBE9058957.1 carboxypeptidase regulatory-like domain-containing protein [Sphaerospermopsis sp. LEGE 08334]